MGSSIKRILLVIVFILISCVGRPTQEEMQNANYGPYPSNYQEIIKNYYSSILFDPYSAVYEFTQPRQYAWSDRYHKFYGYAVCGSVNAKNRFGGYVGAELFFVMINNNQVILRYEGFNANDACKQSLR